LRELDEKHQAGLVPSVTYGLRSVAIRDIVFDNEGRTGLLIRLIDPDIPDNIMENIKDSTLREAKRGEDEVPALSAHVVFDASDKFDTLRSYPCAIENIDFLPRSLIANYLIRAMGDALGEKRYHEKSKEEREYRPRISFAGHPSKTIASVLNRGGKLHGMHFETTSIKEDGFGEEAYPVTKVEEVHLKVGGRPQGARAVTWIKEQVGRFRHDGETTAKIVMEDESGRVKTSKLDARFQDATDNFFILQEKITGFTSALRACEASVRPDVMNKMAEKLPTQ
jgi:hypothetical protein